MWVITDGKLDDCLALVILYKWMLETRDTVKGMSYQHQTLDIVVTNISDIEGAVILLDLLLADVAKVLVRNKLSKALKLPQVCFYAGKRMKEAKSHEIELYNEVKESAKIESATLPTIHPWTNEQLQNASGDWVFALAPCDSFMSLLSIAAYVFIGIGYNSSVLSFEQLHSLNLMMINNQFSYCVGEEGGRFDVDDEELWNVVYEMSPRFRMIKKHALDDTRRFIARQLFKFGKQTNILIDYDFVSKNPLSADTLEKAKTIQSRIGPGSYLDRIVEQLEKGALQVECTDGQHMALWLHNFLEMKFVNISRGKKGISLRITNTKTKFHTYFELKRCQTRKIFIQSLKIA